MDMDNAKASKRQRRGKGRKERMRHRIEKLMLENKEEKQRTKTLASKNMALKRPVTATIVHV